MLYIEYTLYCLILCSCILSIPFFLNYPTLLVHIVPLHKFAFISI